MIILEEGLKNPTDPSAGPTNRVYPQPDPAALGSPSRSSSPHPTLPDYETSEAQQSSNHRKPSGFRKIWNTRVGRLLSYALAAYSTFVLVVGVPTFVLVGLFLSTFLVPYGITQLKRALGVEITP
jgi:hypothetical protein